MLRGFSAAEIEAVAGAVADQEDRSAEEGIVQVGPEEGSPVLEEGTIPGEEDRSSEEGHWGNREDQLGDHRSESCPEAEEGIRKEGKVGVVEGPGDLEDRATAAAAVVAAAGWAEGNHLEGRLAGLGERREEVLRPVTSQGQL